LKQARKIKAGKNINISIKSDLAKSLPNRFCSTLCRTNTKMNTKLGKYILKAQSISTYFPVFFVAFFTTYAIHVRILLGRWPTVYNDNPINFFLNIHEWFLIIFLYSALAAIVVWPFFSIYLLWKKCYTRFLKTLIIFLFPLVIFILINMYDTSGYIEWFWD
jgi:hypothetical protein